MEKMNVNEFIADSLNKMAKMSISQLKKLLQKVVARRNPDDAHTIKTIRALIEKKKKEYPVQANQMALKRMQTLKAANAKKAVAAPQVGNAKWAEITSS